MASVQINLSKSKYSNEYFQNIKNNPGKYFRDFRVAAIRKEISNFKFNNFSDECKLVAAEKNNTLNVEINNRKGYFNVVFFA